MTDAWSDPAGAGTDASAPDPLVAELARMWPDDGRAIRRPGRRSLALLAGAVAAVLVVDTAPGLGILLTGLAIGAASLPTLRTGWVRTSWPSAPSACCCSPSSWCATHPGSSR